MVTGESVFTLWVGVGGREKESVHLLISIYFLPSSVWGMCVKERLYAQ